MKTLNYKDHLGPEGQYQCDWEREGIRYVEPLHGVRIYAHGEVVVSRSGYRDPDWRRDFQSLTGLSSNMVKDDFYGKQFFSPSGEPIKKNSIKDGILIYDPERKVAYGAKNWRGELSFFYHDELARADQMVEVVVPQPLFKAKKLAELKECIDLGTTMDAVGEHEPFYRRKSLTHQSRLILDSGKYPVDLTKKLAQEFCLNIVRAHMELDAYLTEKTSNRHFYPYLIVEEK